jgi:hypothetical protein
MLVCSYKYKHGKLIILITNQWIIIPKNAVIIVTRLWSGWSHCPNPGCSKRISLFQRVWNGSRAHPPLYLMGTRIFSQGYSSQEMKLTPHPKIVSELKMNKAVPLLPPYVSMVKTETTVSLENIQCNGKKITQHNAFISNILLLCFIVI